MHESAIQCMLDTRGDTHSQFRTQQSYDHIRSIVYTAISAR